MAALLDPNSNLELLSNLYKYHAMMCSRNFKVGELIDVIPQGRYCRGGWVAEVIDVYENGIEVEIIEDCDIMGERFKWGQFAMVAPYRS